MAKTTNPVNAEIEGFIDLQTKFDAYVGKEPYYP